MSSLFSNLRFYVLLFSGVLSLAIYLFVTQTIPEGGLQTIRLTQYFALTAVTYLYLALLPDGLAGVFPHFPLRAKYTRARRAIGVSAFYFATLHASLAFFGQLGGFPGLGFLDGKYLLAISLSFTALVILSLMAATSFDFMVTKLTFARWKFLHRFVYLAATLITVHALMLGTHFADLSAIIPQIFSLGLAILLFLEANRFDAFLEKRFKPNISSQNTAAPNYFLPHFGPTVILVLVLVSWYIFSNSGSLAQAGVSLNVHSQHIQLAKDAQQSAASSQTNQSNLPPYLQGDKTKRFSVSFLHPDIIEASQDAKLQFLVSDAANGSPVNFFTKFYEKPLHLIIVDSSLRYFTHIHPDQVAGGFAITTQFPKNDVYHLYQDFQPVGAIEQQFAFSLPVGATASASIANFTPESSGTTKQFGEYEVTLHYPQPLQSSQISIGSQKLTFTIKDSKTHQGLTNLKPYLAAFGHLVMINQQTFDYVHVHPSNLTTPAPDATSGPEVDFLPLGLYSPIKPGIYRLFAQFNPDGKLFTADFSIKVE